MIQVDLLDDGERLAFPTGTNLRLIKRECQQKWGDGVLTIGDEKSDGHYVYARAKLVTATMRLKVYQAMVRVSYHNQHGPIEETMEALSDLREALVSLGCDFNDSVENALDSVMHRFDVVDDGTRPA